LLDSAAIVQAITGANIFRDKRLVIGLKFLKGLVSTLDTVKIRMHGIICGHQCRA